jgi:hypothetical protein
MKDMRRPCTEPHFQSHTLFCLDWLDFLWVLDSAPVPVPLPSPNIGTMIPALPSRHRRLVSLKRARLHHILDCIIRQRNATHEKQARSFSSQPSRCVTTQSLRRCARPMWAGVTSLRLSKIPVKTDNPKRQTRSRCFATKSSVARAFSRLFTEIRSADSARVSKRKPVHLTTCADGDNLPGWHRANLAVGWRLR